MGTTHVCFRRKKEDKRRKARLVVGGHFIDSSSLPTYSSVVQKISIRLLLLIAKENNLNIATGDVGNACINAKVGESVHSRSGEEWGDKSVCVLETLKALHGLKNSVRKWLFYLGDTLRDMRFSLSRADPDLWMKSSSHHAGFDFIGTFLDDLIAVATEPLQCLEVLASKFNIRNVSDCPDFFLSSNWTNDNDKTRA